MRRVLLLLLVVVAMSIALQPRIHAGQAVTLEPPAPLVFDPEVTVSATTTISSGGTKDHHARASVKVVDGVAVLIYRRATAHNATGAELEIRFSNDYGATWTAANTKLGGGAVTNFPMTPATGDISAGLGWLMKTASGRLVIHMTSFNGTFPSTINDASQSTSDDGGETWTTPAQVSTLEAGGNSDFLGSDGYLYTPVAVPGDTDWNPVESFLLRTTDNGSTWGTVGQIVETGDTDQSAEMGLTQIGTSSVLAIVRDKNNGNTYKTSSSDLGVTWGAFTDITATVGIVGQPRLYTKTQLQGGANYWLDPKLILIGYVAVTPGSSMPRRNAIWLSNDSGVTWDGPHYVDSQTDDAGYGDGFYDPDNDQWVIINYTGSLTAASVKQYRLTITGW